MPDAVACRGLWRRYRTPTGWVDALVDVDLTFAAGTLGALVGPSGSGKSTLLRVLAGIDPADRGEACVAGNDVAGMRSGALRAHRRNTVAYIAQRAAANLIPHLTVREQLADASVAAALGLEHRLDARARELSGGEQARAALAVGLARGTPIVLVDEPTAELDRGSAEAVTAALESAVAAGRTVIVATHDPDLVALADTRIELMQAHTHGDASPPPPPRQGEPVIAARDLTKRYAGRAVVDGVNLELRPGELGVLLGRSGSGKSTLLMVLAGFIAPDSGTMRTPGRSWQETAYLPQRFGLLPELSVAENVALPARLTGAPDDVAPLLEALGLDGLGDRLPAETSIGQQQRTALARAIAPGPAALLVDEPTSHQDAASAELAWDALTAACAAGTACLVATHDEAATARAHRVWRIEDGRIV
ncbi:MAG TPA: ATP-binding cassette domain-containing protein [Gaiellaceae bacterium]|nr:ATP-binding cassette domain-containing protein [Gaiellaceae bacterium]